MVEHNKRACNTVVKYMGECAICFKALYNNYNYIMLKCGHDYCASCIFENQKKCK
jgi:hypothetical protein